MSFVNSRAIFQPSISSNRKIVAISFSKNLINQLSYRKPETRNYKLETNFRTFIQLFEIARRDRLICLNTGNDLLKVAFFRAELDDS